MYKKIILWYNKGMENFLRWLVDNKNNSQTLEKDVFLQRLLSDKQENGDIVKNIVKFKWGDGTGPLITQRIKYIDN